MASMFSREPARGHPQNSSNYFSISPLYLQKMAIIKIKIYYEILIIFYYNKNH